MERALVRPALVVLAALSLAGCQLDNRVTVFARSGHLFFKTIWHRIGRDQPASVERLKVTEVSASRRVVWDVESTETNGHELSELQYGGVPSRFRQTVAPTRLQAGQVYRVDLYALGGMDEAYFVITPEEISRDVSVLHE